ncbi:hypothetical protein EK21DRAFT_109302 [Setomelanomma holmii]|uniref:Uncharacterized protein n=1 Tax=Setomelanomma holmii TaxID=210430 RepID=A0A9P4LPH2_9PLEO|nr:hypothetical protein EK21DRAFT_109302 [Setomelanomma holmii]
MSIARGIYNIDQVHDILRYRCPQALAKFPNPKVFYIRPDTQGDGHPELRIGCCMDKDRKTKEYLWMKETTDDPPAPLYFTTKHGEIRPVSGTKVFAGFIGEGVFGKIYKDGLTHGAIATHSLFKYVMLICGYKDVWNDRLDFPETIAEQEKGDLRGLSIALRNIARRMPDVQKKKVEEAVVEDDAKVILADGGTKKRVRETEEEDEVEDAKVVKKKQCFDYDCEHCGT